MAKTFKDELKTRWLLVLIGGCFYFFAIIIHKNSPRPEIKISKQDSSYTLNSTFLKLISIGNKRVFSNVLWVLTLLESDQEKYHKKDFSDWMYLRFHTVATLDPKFYQNYLYGGMYLSTIKDDLEGAAVIFELGIKEFPEDYYLKYYAGFNYFYEMGDFKRGYEMLRKIENHPKLTSHLRSIIGKLNFEVTKNYDVSLEFLKESIRLTNDEVLRTKLRSELYALQAQRDLECLNSGRKGCYLVDLEGKSYIKETSGRWRAQKTFSPYKIKRTGHAETLRPTSH
jgi:tetratricopeptide (TPR) repeat protein